MSDKEDNNQAGDDGEGEDIEDMKRRIEEMENEHDTLDKAQTELESQIKDVSVGVDENSIYVGQVDYGSTPDEIRAHFAPCGTINRITIMCDKRTGNPKGFAYVEFTAKEAVDNALKLNDTEFRGRQLKVLPKQKKQVFSGGRGGRGGGRGRFDMGRGGGRGGYGGRTPFRGRASGRRGGFRGRGRGYY